MGSNWAWFQAEAAAGGSTGTGERSAKLVQKSEAGEQPVEIQGPVSHFIQLLFYITHFLLLILPSIQSFCYNNWWPTGSSVLSSPSLQLSSIVSNWPLPTSCVLSTEFLAKPKSISNPPLQQNLFKSRCGPIQNSVSIQANNNKLLKIVLSLLEQDPFNCVSCPKDYLKHWHILNFKRCVSSFPN